MEEVYMISVGEMSYGIFEGMNYSDKGIIIGKENAKKFIDNYVSKKGNVGDKVESSKSYKVEYDDGDKCIVARKLKNLGDKI